MEPTEYLAHHGVKGQKWGVRRTPEQLGHPSTPRAKPKPKTKREAIVAGAKKAATTASKAKAYVDKRNADKQRKIVDTAMATRKKKDLAKAMRYMSDEDLKKLADRQRLEQQVMSNAGGKRGNSDTVRTIRKGVDQGTSDALKEANRTFMSEAIKPVAGAAGKAAGQAILSEAAKVAISAAAKKYGVDPKVAQSVAETFKTAVSEDFAGAAKVQRTKFVEKNNLGKEWENAKAKQTAEKVAEKTSNILDIVALTPSATASSRSAAEREAAAYRAGKKAGRKKKKNKNKNQSTD